MATITSQGLSVGASPTDRVSEVVGHEKAPERDHDQVVEEENPARYESGRVVEGPADEGRRAAGLRNRRRPLSVRDRHQHEENPQQEHPGREPERLECDDAQREEDRRADLAVGHRRNRRGIKNAPQTFRHRPAHPP